MRKTGSLVALVLLAAAVILFVVSCFTFRRKPGWLVSAGLACFAGSFLAAQTL